MAFNSGYIEELENQIAELEDTKIELQQKVLGLLNKLSGSQDSRLMLIAQVRERNHALERCVLRGLQLEAALKAALDYIDASPVDPDITVMQAEAYLALIALNPRDLLS